MFIYSQWSPKYFTFQSIANLDLGKKVHAAKAVVPWRLELCQEKSCSPPCMAGTRARGKEHEQLNADCANAQVNLVVFWPSRQFISNYYINIHEKL